MLHPLPNNEAESADTSMSMNSIDDGSAVDGNKAQPQHHHVPLMVFQQPTMPQIPYQPTVSYTSVQPLSISHIEWHSMMNQQQPLGLNTSPATHNLIPFNYRPAQINLLPTLNGTPGYPPAIIPQILHPQLQPGFASFQMPIQSNQAIQIYTLQDSPNKQPIYNGINPNFPGLRVLHTHPPIFCVDNFLTEYECTFLIDHASDSFGPAPVVGKGAGEVSPSRTSSTCYLAREDLPDILRKISLLTGKPFEHFELPQVGRYFPTQQYLQHYDAFDLSTEDGRRFAMNGGQRTVTVLIYLNTVHCGGATRFPALDIEVQPVRGMALVFFPATVDGLLDKMALHAALPAIDTKYVSQVWIRQSVYAGQPSKRLPQPLGVPFGSENSVYNQHHHGSTTFSQQQQQQIGPKGLVSPMNGMGSQQHFQQLHEQQHQHSSSEMQF
jgi:prolyl 4-hydroxylase